MSATPPTTVVLRCPSKYPSTASTAFTPPPIEWLLRTWTIVHSTLSMWRSARNVRLTYSSLPPKANGLPRIDDFLEYESNKGSSSGTKTVKGVDTASSATDNSAWDWRGKGLLTPITSHWEVLGWGDRPLAGGEVERWAVTWFAPTIFTKEGVDIYCDRKEGLSEETYGLVLEALKGLEAKPTATLVEKEMQPVEIKLPWNEK